MADLLAELRRRDPALAATALVAFGLLALAVVLGVLDDRTLLGVSVWLKPAKFGASIGIYLATLAWLRPHLQAEGRLRWARPLIIGAMVIELVGIYLQAARGVGSHFNEATPLDAAVFAVMGLAILVNTVALVGLTLAAMRARPSIAPAYLWGIRLGLVIGVLAGLQGGLMIAMVRHSVGVADGGPGLPITGWSTRGGDLRVAHFLGMHAMQVLPLLGWWLARRAGADPARQAAAARAIGLLALVHVAVFVGVLLLALLGLPLVPL